MSHDTEREDADYDERDDTGDEDRRRKREQIAQIRADAVEAIKPNKREPTPDATVDGE